MNNSSIKTAAVLSAFMAFAGSALGQNNDQDPFGQLLEHIQHMPEEDQKVLVDRILEASQNLKYSLSFDFEANSSGQLQVATINVESLDMNCPAMIQALDDLVDSDAFKTLSRQNQMQVRTYAQIAKGFMGMGQFEFQQSFQMAALFPQLSTQIAPFDALVPDTADVNVTIACAP